MKCPLMFKTACHVKYLLQNYPETRNSYETLLIKYIDRYCAGDYKLLKLYSINHIFRTYRKIQNDWLCYQPDDDVKKIRKQKKNQYANKNIV